MAGTKMSKHEVSMSLRKSVEEAVRLSGRAESASLAADLVLGFEGNIPDSQGDEPLFRLVSFDADRIGQFVFASERPPVVSGASLLLETLNAKILNDPRRLDGDVTGLVYSAGGGGILVCAARGDRTQLVSRIRDALERDLYDLTFTVAAVDVSGRDLVAAAPVDVDDAGLGLNRFKIVQGVPALLTRLQIALREAKDGAPRYGAIEELNAPSGAAAERCVSCGARAPGDRKVHHRDKGNCCDRCYEIRQFFSKERRAHQGGSDAKSFNEIAETGGRGVNRKYLAYLAIDGNAFGRVVQGVTTLQQLAVFSRVVTEIFEMARSCGRRTLREIVHPDAEAQDLSIDMLGGGDEITMVMPSRPAVQVALAVLKAIEAGFNDATKEGGVLHEAFVANPELLEQLRSAGASGGLVISPSSYPVRLLRRYGDQIQKSAKSWCAQHPGSRSSLYWTLITDSSPLVTGAESRASRGYEAGLSDIERLIEESRLLAGDRGVAYEFIGELEEIEREMGEFGIERDEIAETTARHGANLLEYRVALCRERPSLHPYLVSWWGSVAESDEQQVTSDLAYRFFHEMDGKERLRRLIELASLEAKSEYVETSR